MKALIAISVAVVCFVAAGGCKTGSAEKEYEPMGSKAPEFGSTPDLATVQGFIVGKWALTDYSDPIFAKQLGLESIAAEEKPDKEWWYEFSKDGSFKCGNTGQKWQAEGHYAVNGNQVGLTYETMAGRTIQEAQAEYQKREESGRGSAIMTAMVMESVFKSFQMWITVEVASDKKRLYFSGTGTSIAGASGNAPPVGGKGLERMAEKTG